MHVPLFPINKGMLVLIIIYLLVQIKVMLALKTLFIVTF